MKLYLKKAEDFTIKDIINLREFRKPKAPLRTYRGSMICSTCKTTFDIEGVNFCSHCGQKAKWTKYWREEKRKENLRNRIIWATQFHDFDIG